MPHYYPSHPSSPNWSQRQDDEHLEHDHQQNRQHSLKQLHGLLLTLAWFVLLQLGIWSHMFRSYRYALVMHVLCMSVLAVFCVVGVTVMLTMKTTQIIWQDILHQTIGFYLIVIVLPLAILNGILCKLFLHTNTIKPNQLHLIKQAHRILGWLMVILSKIPLFTGWQEDQVWIGVGIVVLDLLLYGLYWYFKITGKKVGDEEAGMVDYYGAGEKSVGSLGDYRREYGGTCFLFGNLVYRVYPVMEGHPGGITIIQHIIDRQVDRFLYGMQMLQKYSKGIHQRHTHTTKIHNLLSPPLASIKIRQQFTPLPPLSPCTISPTSLLLISTPVPSLLILYLKPLDKLPYQQGYTSITQLGRYRCLNVDGIIRLYSCVEFLRTGNVGFMRGIVGEKWYGRYCRVGGNVDRKDMVELEQKLLTPNPQQQATSNQHIPMLIKVYGDGKMSQKLLHPQNISTPIVLSQCKGVGLALDYFRKQLSLSSSPTRIVILTGGTGLYPFCDLIDLLYKHHLLQQKSPLTPKLLLDNPILNCQPFLPHTYKLILYTSVQTIHAIHPITMFQLNQLAKHGYMQVNLKIEQHSQHITMFESIKLINLIQRFQSIVEREYEIDREARFLVCGPARMSQPVMGKLGVLGVESYKYRVI